LDTLPITDEERSDYSAEFRQELEQEHVRRLDRLDQQKQRIRDRKDERSRRAFESEKADLRNELRKKFYEEKGYQLYTDSSGRDFWLTAEEYKYRTGRRRKRVQRKKTKVMGLRWRTVALYMGAMAIAVLVGLAMTRG